MAIDRPRMIADFGIEDWQEAVTLSPESLTSRGEVPRADWTRLNQAERWAAARERLADVIAQQEAPRLTLWLPEGAGSDLMFEHIRADLSAVGLVLARAGSRDDADLELIDRVAHYDDVLWFLGQLRCARVPLCSRDADDRISAAQAAVPAHAPRVTPPAPGRRAIRCSTSARRRTARACRG